jgi:diguanylate cyclase (GGDEF)-like protein
MEKRVLSFGPNMRRFSCVAAAAALAFANCLAQSLDPADPSKLSVSQYRIDGWQTEQGLPQNTVQAMLQTRDGRLWVGTGGGLARFDGARFTTFETSPVPDLSARPIFGFMEAADGALWIGHSRGATRYSGGRFERVVTDEHMQGRRVWAFAQGPDGVVWAASENGLARIEGRSVTMIGEAEGLPTRRLRALAFDRAGTLWIGTTGAGLLAYRDGRFRKLDPSNGFPHAEVRHVLADPAGGVWAATAGAGLLRIEPDGRMRVYGTAQGLPTDQLTYLALDRSGALWIATWGAGIARMADGMVTSLSSTGGLAGDQLWAIHADQEGGIWAGTWHGGLNRLSPRPFVVFGRPEGLAGDNVRSVMRARDGAMWVATAGGGVNRIEHGRIVAGYSKREGLPSDEASALFEDHDGAVWVATYTGGLARLHEGKVTTYGTRDGLPNVDVRVVQRDRSGVLWVGTVNGLARFDGKRFAPPTEPGAPTEGVGCIHEDREGTLWFGTAGSGLYRLRGGRFDRLTRKEGLGSNWIMAMHEDADGTLWIGTNGEGLTRLREGKLKNISPADGLWDGLAQTILADAQGNFWLTGNRGFFRVSRDELNAFADGRAARVASTGYGPGDALRVTTFAGNVQPAGAVDARGVLWLPSLKGLVIVDPARLPRTSGPPIVAVEDVLVNGSHVAATDRVELPPGSALLTIHYAAATLANADRVRFRYRVEGVSDDWVEAGRSREATFPALPHGSYTFQVAASYDGRNWGEGSRPLAIRVPPRYYETSWFLALVLLAAFVGGMGLWQLRTYRVRQRAVEMERLVATRTEELRVANEHLSRLSSLDSLTGLANRRGLDATLDAEWRRAARAQAPLAAVICDIDAFKAYNDSLGHPEGDRCLAAVAEVIRRCTNRAGDFAARYGGEEFVILIPGADRAEALAFADALRREVEARAIPHPASAVAPVVTVSLGVAARVPAGDASAEGLVAEADAALYRAKQEGRNLAR